MDRYRRCGRQIRSPTPVTLLRIDTRYDNGHDKLLHLEWKRGLASVSFSGGGVQ